MDVKAVSLGYGLGFSLQPAWVSGVMVGEDRKPQNGEHRMNETPNSKWNNWALIEAARKVPMDSLTSLLTDRLEQIAGDNEKAGPRAYVVKTGGFCGVWARGKTLVEACEGALKHGAKRTEIAQVWLILNDAEPYVDQMGGVNSASQSAMFSIGNVGTIGSVLNANKS